MTSSISPMNRRAAEQGSALIYILIAIALLAMLTVTFMEPSSNQTQSQNSFKTVSELQSQAEFIRSSVQECVMLYPGGDAEAISEGVQANQPYPLRPSISYFDNCDGAGASTNDSVQYLRCPGLPASTAPEDVACHSLIFGGKSAKFLPPIPDLFTKMPDGANGWQWYNGADGVFIWIATNKTDSFIQTAMEKLDENFAECEADVIDATTTARVLATDDPSLVCPSGSTCFRVRLIANPSSMVYNGDVAGDEANCVTP